MNSQIQLPVKTYPRLAALLAVFLWSSGALLVLGLSRLPTFFLLACSGTIALVLNTIRLTVKGRWGLIWSHKGLLSLASTLIIANQIGYVVAFRWAPPAQIDLIYYLWPSVLVLITHRSSNPLLAALIVVFGAGGLFLAFGKGTLEPHYLPGYIVAILAAASWIAYTMIVKGHDVPMEFLSVCLGFGAPLFWVLHFMTAESTVSLTGGEVVWLCVYGGGVYTASYLLWGYAVASADIKTVSPFSYLIPLLSILELCVFGYAEFTLRIGAATSLVLVAATLPMIEPQLMGVVRRAVLAWNFRAGAQSEISR